MKLRGVKRTLIKHYVFAISTDDFAAFTGLQPRNGYNHVKTDKERFIFVKTINDIKDAELKYPSQIKWKVSITDAYNELTDPGYLASVKLFCNQDVNLENIPDVLKGFL